MHKRFAFVAGNDEEKGDASALPVLESAPSSEPSTDWEDKETIAVAFSVVSTNSGASGASGRLLASTSCRTANLPLSLASTHCQRPLISSADLLAGAYSLTARPALSASW